MTQETSEIRYFAKVYIFCPIPKIQHIRRAKEIAKSFNPLSLRVEKREADDCEVIAGFATRDEAFSLYHTFYNLRVGSYISVLIKHQGRTFDIWESPEKRIRQELKEMFGGESEVRIPSGRIDLLTDKYLIEVKNLDRWKEALGQITMYAPFYPEKLKRIYFFSKRLPMKGAKKITSICSSQNIEAIFLHDLGFNPDSDRSFKILDYKDLMLK